MTKKRLHSNEDVFKYIDFFQVGSMLILIKYHKHQESVGTRMYFFCFEVFYSFISITHPTPKEKAVITMGSCHVHKDFIRITVFSFTGFNMNVENIWRPWNFNLLLSPRFSSTLQLPGEGVGGGGRLSVFSFSYIFIYFSHRVSRCSIMFIHGVA